MQSIRSLPPTQYHQTPGPSAWSAGQIANHLYLSERLSMAYVHKKMQYPDTIPPYRPGSWLGVWSIRLASVSPFRFQAPKAIDMRGDQKVMDPGQLDQAWSQLRMEMITALTAYSEQVGNRLVYRHPKAGRMTLHQMLLFFKIHLRHHHKQLRRTLHTVARAG